MSTIGVQSDRDQSVRVGFGVLLASVLLAVSVPQDAGAQGEIAGRVMAADSGRPPVSGAEATIAKLRLRALSDSSGRFRFRNVPPGAHVMVLRAAGFQAESSTLTIDFDEVVSWEVSLKRSGTMLAERVVTAAAETAAPAKLSEFFERQKLGVGHFIGREQLQKAEGGMRQTGDILSQLTGVIARRGSNRIWIASGGRAQSTACAFCASVEALNPVDFAAGARPACYMDVFLDGVMIFDSRIPTIGLFDVNTIQPGHIAGIEVYPSAQQVPAKYNRSGGLCGVLLIWTR